MARPTAASRLASRASAATASTASPASGDKDGYDNLGLRGRAAAIAWHPPAGRRVRLRAYGRKSEFDGFDPVTFLHADTLDETRNKLAAGRLFAELGNREKAYAIASASLLGSSNRNDVDDDFLNRDRSAGAAPSGWRAAIASGSIS